MRKVWEAWNGITLAKVTIQFLAAGDMIQKVLNPKNTEIS
jgi:hypothetical protein